MAKGDTGPKVDYEQAGKLSANQRRRIRSVVLRGSGLRQVMPQRPIDQADKSFLVAGIGGPVFDHDDVKASGPTQGQRAAPASESPGPEQPDDEDEGIEIPTKILLTEYAIGQGLISREEYGALRDQYFTQSQATLGLILPTIGIIVAINFGGSLDLDAWVSWLLGGLVLLALLSGLDRLHKYYSELQTLIVSRYVARVIKAREEAAKDSKPKPKDPLAAVTLADVQKAIADLRTLVETLPKAPITIINERRSES